MPGVVELPLNTGVFPIELRFEPSLRLSEEDFWRLCQNNPHLSLERTADGSVEIMAPAGAESDRRNTDILGEVWSWNRRSGLGVAFGPSAGFTLPSTAVRGPDVAWIARERWDAIPRDDREKFAHIAPDFVAEVCSPSQSIADLEPKMREYIEQGVRLASLLDPKSRVVQVYRNGRPVETLHRPETLSGEDVLPGFVLELKGILFE